MSDKFKEGDEVTIDGISDIFHFYYYYDKRRCVLNSHKSGLIIEETRLLKPYNRPLSPTLFLYKISPAHRNWRFSGFTHAIVTAEDSTTAALLSPKGDLVKNWPEEGWADGPEDIRVEKIGIPFEGTSKNQILSSSYQEG